ncbi:hypothetical protein L9F63_020831 [Diploptera punctata]|uniref:DUF4817 domain-containing protein n=1 Tax=Diploptera punctata TaxID=6984 RepID=A0AAD7ZQ71_DIPPU|nr:hypothetical protein L9F63_020831 [Diploptera punctata]
MLDNNGIKQNSCSSKRAQAVFWYAETKSIITVQRNYRREYGGNSLDGKTIKAWLEKFLATGSVKKESKGARTRVSDEKIQEIRAGFQISLQKSIRQISGSSMCRDQLCIECFISGFVCTPTRCKLFNK